MPNSRTCGWCSRAFLCPPGHPRKYCTDQCTHDARAEKDKNRKREIAAKAGKPPAKQFSPIMTERTLSDDEWEFGKAMERYKRENRRPFPTWSEVLEVLASLGYRKIPPGA